MATEEIDTIRISIPAREEMTQIIRLATTAIANRAGFDLDQSDDVNTAMEEVFRFFCSGCAMDEQNVSLNYSIYGDRLQIKAGDSLSSIAGDDSRIGRYCRFILDKVTDGFEESMDHGKYSILITKLSSPKG